MSDALDFGRYTFQGILLMSLFGFSLFQPTLEAWGKVFGTVEKR